MTTTRSSSFGRNGTLIVVTARVVGPASMATVQLVLDTGAVATTLTPAVIDKIGYAQRDGHRRTKVRSAIGEETGFLLRVAELSVLGVKATNFEVNVFPLGHDIDSLLGMDFLSRFNIEIRMTEQRIILELL